MAQRVAMPSMAFSRSGNDTSQKTGPKPKAFKPKRQQATQRPTDAGRGRGGGGRGAGRGGRGKGKNGKDPNFMSLRAAKKDVFDFGATGLSRRQQKIRENEKMVAFGAKAEKAQKMPLKMLLGIRRAEDKREKKILDERRASGVVAPTEKRDATRGGAKPKRKRRPGDLLPESRDGVMRVGHLLKKAKKR